MLDLICQYESAGTRTKELIKISDQTEDGGMLKILTVLDEFTRESPDIEFGRTIRARDVIGVLIFVFSVTNFHVRRRILILI